MIVVKNLSKTFGSIKAVDNVSFCINKGEVVALLGPNGAGKTTLLRLFTGFYNPTQGEVRINGYDVSSQRLKALQKIAYVPENGALYPEMSVYEYLNFIAQVHRLPTQAFVDNLTFLVKQFDLSGVINQKCETLSKGFKRRVAIAGALLHQPEVLILDEPTEGLDPNQKYDIRQFLREYGKEHVVIISTHIMEEVEAFSNRVILLNHGKLVRDTSPDELKRISPYNDLETAFRTITFEQ